METHRPRRNFLSDDHISSAIRWLLLYSSRQLASGIYYPTKCCPQLKILKPIQTEFLLNLSRKIWFFSPPNLARKYNLRKSIMKIFEDCEDGWKPAGENLTRCSFIFFILNFSIMKFLIKAESIMKRLCSSRVLNSSNLIPRSFPSIKFSLRTEFSSKYAR